MSSHCLVIIFSLVKDIRQSFLKSHFSHITDSIEANVESAAVHVETANVQLEKAKNYQVSETISIIL